jgi:uncharacterized protein
MALAQEAPSFDCAQASHAAEELVCTDAALAGLDRALATSYRAALEVAQGLDAGASEAEAALRVTQRGWIGGRDDCWKAGDGLRDCVEASYLRREAELVGTYMLRAPVSVVAWACDGNPANEVVTLFYATTQPSVRFERGDSIDVGVLTPSATGTRYDGSFGRFIWIEGDTATYRDPDPDATEMTCVPQT